MINIAHLNEQIGYFERAGAYNLLVLSFLLLEI